MSLQSSCRELQEIAELVNREHELVRLMRRHGEPPCVSDEVMTYSGGIAQLHLMNSVLLCAALDLEMEAALNPA